MSTEPDQELFTVSIQSQFAEDGVWTIEARLTFRGGGIPPRGNWLLLQGQVALINRVLRHAREGRCRGATRVRALMDAGCGPVDITTGVIFPEIYPSDLECPHQRIVRLPSED